MDDDLTLPQKIERLGEDSDLLHAWTHGDESATVALGGVDTPSPRKMMHDLDVRETAAAQAAIAAGVTAAENSATAAANSAQIADAGALVVTEHAAELALVAGNIEAIQGAAGAAAQAAAHAEDAAASAAAAAAAVPENLVVRVSAAEQDITQQNTRLNAVESGVTALATTLIGSVQAITAADSYVPNGCVPANGGEYTRAQFTTLYDTYLAGGKLLTCTYAAWAAQVAQTGNCAKFALDVEAQKFRVPLYKDGDSITQAASAAELGRSVKAGLPNITGTFEPWSSAANPAAAATGAFKIVGSGNNNSRTSGSAGTGSDTFTFDPSRVSSVYGNSSTVTDEQVRLRHFVVLASAQNDASVFDWSNYMAALAGKANTDLGNVNGNAMKYLLYVRDEKAQGVSGGSTTSGAWHTRDLQTIKKNEIGATVAANRVTFPAGTYIIKASAPCFAGMHTRLGLYNVTATAMLHTGPTGRTNTGSAHIIETRVEGVFTFAAPTTLELRMYTASGNTYGMGYPESPISGIGEVYSELWAWKI